MGVRHAIGDLRNRLVANPDFRRFAKGFPLTRGVARREARDLFDLMAGFVYSQTLLACVQTGLFALLADGPKSLDAIADHTGLPRAGAERLARAAQALDLVEARGRDRFALGRLGAAMAGDDGLAAMTRHHALLYEDLQDPLAVLRGEKGERLSRFWGYGRAERTEGESDAYSALMAATLPMVAEEIFAAVDLSLYQRLMDVGGGEGAFIGEAARRAPALNLTLFDLPPVAERARARLTHAGLAGRVDVRGGSFLHDSLPPGADLISLVRILHDHGDDEVRRLLAACRAALAPGGTLLVAEPMAGAPGAAAMGEAYFGFYLAAMGRGRPRTLARVSDLLTAAGFTAVTARRARIPLIANIVTAKTEKT